MKVLVVEDDDNKRAWISHWLESTGYNADVSFANSYSSGVASAIQITPDLILLDMQLPTFDKSSKEAGGRLRHFAGLHLLQRLKSRKIKTKVVVVTQFKSFGEGEQRISFDVLKDKLASEFEENFSGIVYLEASEAAWQADLAEILKKNGLGQ